MVSMKIALFPICAFIVVVFNFSALAEDHFCESAFDGSAFQWLENNDNPKVAEWVKGANSLAVERLSHDPRFEEVRQKIIKLFSAKDRLPGVTRMGDYLYNHWQDEKHPRGIYRRTTLEEYRKNEPKWETVLDLDALSEGMEEGWALASVAEEEGQHRRAMIRLSIGGRDAVVTREFDLQKMEFVKGGFELPAGRTSTTWLDENTLLVGAANGEGTLSGSHYPLTVRVWKRGTPLSEAREIFRAEKTDLGVWSYVEKDPVTGKKFVGIKRWIDGDRSADYLIDEDDHARQLPFPSFVNREAISNEQMFMIAEKDWVIDGTTFKAGELLQIPLEKVFSFTKDDVKTVFKTDDRTSLGQVIPSGDKLYLVVRHNVTDHLYEAKWLNDRFVMSEIPTDENVTIEVASLDRDSGEIILTIDGFLQPPSIYRLAEGRLEVLRKGIQRFKAEDFKSEQFWTKSEDGTMIPYFIVHHKYMEYNGHNPTLMYGYGGFKHALMPGYSGFTGQTILEKGGVYVLANIRGGNEFGPSWHEAVLREKRHKAFEDFAAIGRDLIRRGITNPKNLAIQGGSNGGLLVGAVATRYPELCNAVLCEVPVLDMLRFHKLLAGSSWMSEWGNPDDPQDAEFLRRYSPYHNVFSERNYPEIFFRTSTADDRVHPAHARKMYARLRSLGYPALLFESIEGGHTSTATTEERAFNAALEVIYFYQKIFDHK